MAESTFIRSRKYWDSLEPGAGITARELVIATDGKIQTASSLLCQLVKKNLAVRNGTKDGYIVYEKPPLPPQTTGLLSKPEQKEGKHEGPQLTALEVGAAIICLVEHLKSKVGCLKSRLDEKDKEIAQWVEEHQRACDDLRTAKLKINELNDRLQAGQKTINLHELNQFFSALPPAKH